MVIKESTKIFHMIKIVVNEIIFWVKMIFIAFGTILKSLERLNA